MSTTDSAGASAAEHVSLSIMTSRYAVSELLWQDGTWLWVHDRPLGTLTDAAVLECFGDDAFRRRDQLLSSGERAALPRIAPLIGRRIVSVFREGNWQINADDSRTFRATSAQSSRYGTRTVEVTATTSNEPIVLHVDAESQQFTSVHDAELRLRAIAAKRAGFEARIPSGAEMERRRGHIVRMLRRTPWPVYEQEVPRSIRAVADKVFVQGDYAVLLDETAAERWPEVSRRFARELFDELVRERDSDTERTAIELRIAVLTTTWFALGERHSPVIDYANYVTEVCKRWSLRYEQFGYNSNETLWPEDGSALPAVRYESRDRQVSLAWWSFRPSASLSSALAADGTLRHLDDSERAALAIPEAFEADVARAVTLYRDAERDREGARYQLEQHQGRLGFPVLPRRFAAGLEAATVGSLFAREPHGFGLRGDAYLWQALERRFAAEPMPTMIFELKKLIEDAISELVGTKYPLRSNATEESVYVEQFDTGSGMSAGQVHLRWWEQTGVPILVDRYLHLKEAAQQASGAGS